MPTLAELSIIGGDIDAALETSEGEITPAIEAMLEAFGLHERSNVDGYVAVVDDLDTLIATCEARKRQLDARVRSLKSQRERRAAAMLWYMRGKGVRRLQGIEHEVALVANGRVEPVKLKVDEDAVVRRSSPRVAMALGSEPAARRIVYLTRRDGHPAKLARPDRLTSSRT